MYTYSTIMLLALMHYISMCRIHLHVHVCTMYNCQALLKTSMSTKTSVGDVQGPSTSSIVDDTESSDEEYNPDMSSGDEEEEEEEEEKEEEVEVNNNEDEVEDGVGGETYQVESEGGVARRIHSLMEGIYIVRTCTCRSFPREEADRAKCTCTCT